MFEAVSAIDVNDLILKYVHEAVLMGSVGVGGFVVMFPLQYAVRVIKEKFDILDEVMEELQVQRTNHLTHIEASAEAQTELLKEIAGTLNSMHLDQQKLLGRLEK